MESTTYYCPECGTQQRTNADNENTQKTEDGLEVSECQTCGNEDVHQGTEEDYQDEDDFQDELEGLDGIGPARAEEITEHYEDMEALKEALESGQDTELSTKTEEIVREALELDQSSEE